MAQAGECACVWPRGCVRAAVCVRTRGEDGVRRRGAGAGAASLGKARGGTRPALALPAVAEAAGVSSPGVTPESWVARTPEAEMPADLPKQFFSQLGIIRQRESLRTWMVANRLGARELEEPSGASWLKMPRILPSPPSPRRSLSLWTQSAQLAEGEESLHLLSVYRISGVVMPPAFQAGSLFKLVMTSREE